MILQDKVALVTGGGSGIGRATALLFAEEGAQLCIADISGPAAQETVRMVQAKDAKAVSTVTDVSQESQVQEMVHECLSTFGRIDILFSNAGIIGESLYVPLHELPAEQWRSVLETNLTGMFLCAKHALPVMMSQAGGVVVNTASVAGLVGRPHAHAYTAAKHGVIGLTKHLAIRYAEHNIRANCVAPGSIDTPMSEASQKAAQTQNMAHAGSSHRAPLQRRGSPEEVAQAVLYLASERSAFVTGTCLVIDGGFLAG